MNKWAWGREAVCCSPGVIDFEEDNTMYLVRCKQWLWSTSVANCAILYTKYQRSFERFNDEFASLFCRLIAQQIDRASTRMHGLLVVGTIGALPQCYPVYPRLYRIPSVIAIFGPKSKPVKLLACLHLRIAITGM